jgi:SAM-dependent methyltransferase
MHQTADTSLYSAALLKEIHSRTSALHLSPRRANPLHIFDGIATDSRVLEIGCGGGVLTQAWIERGCSVDAIEFAPHWARVAAARLREQPKARVFQASVRELELRPDYDVVCLNFDHDYAEAWPRGDALREAIGVAASALKPTGVLLVSTSNRLAEPNNRALLTRSQLEAALRAAELTQIDTQLAFPDARLPELLVSDRALTAAPQLRVDELIAQRPLLRDAGNETTQWQRHQEAGTLGQYAPGLLLVARREGIPSPLRTDVLAQSYVDNRVPALDTVTDYVLVNGAIQVVPHKLLGDQYWNTTGFEQVLTPHAYPQGHSLLVEVRRAIHERRTDRMIALLRKWGALVYAQADEDDKIPAEWLDALPAQPSTSKPMAD